LEAEFEKISGDKPRATRFLRSQQEQAAKMEEVAAANGGMLNINNYSKNRLIKQFK